MMLVIILILNIKNWVFVCEHCNLNKISGLYWNYWLKSQKNPNLKPKNNKNDSTNPIFKNKSSTIFH